jgi:hypothetical protein
MHSFIYILAKQEPEEHIGVVDAQFVVHRGVPTLISQVTKNNIYYPIMQLALVKLYTTPTIFNCVFLSTYIQGNGEQEGSSAKVRSRQFDEMRTFYRRIADAEKAQADATAAAADHHR